MGQGSRPLVHRSIVTTQLRETLMSASLELPRRYLVGFDPRELPHHFADVLIIGGGVAGMRTALGIDEPHRVLVVTKDEGSRE